MLNAVTIRLTYIFFLFLQLCLHYIMLYQTQAFALLFDPYVLIRALTSYLSDRQRFATLPFEDISYSIVCLT